MSYVLPVLVALILLYSAAKKVNVYDCFIEGGKKALSLAYTIFPFVSGVLIMIALFKESGLSDYMTKLLEKPLLAVGIPPKLAELLLLRPFSGSGTLACFEDILKTFGANSYEAKCAAVIMGSSETVFYVAAVYFSGTKIKKMRGAVSISLFSSLIGAVVACFLCRFV